MGGNELQRWDLIKANEKGILGLRCLWEGTMAKQGAEAPPVLLLMELLWA